MQSTIGANDMGDDKDLNIFDATQRCLAQISQCTVNENKTFASDARGLEQMLLFWTKHSGVNSRKGMSLDDRLEDHPGIRATFTGLLNLIEMSITHALFSPEDQMDRPTVPGQVSTSDPELTKDLDPDEILIRQKWSNYKGNTWEKIGAAIDILLELTATVRKSTVSVDWSSLQTDFDRPDDYYSEYAKILARRWFPHARRSLTDQLGEAVFIRRRHILYKTYHEQKINYPRPNLSPQVVAIKNKRPSMPETSQKSTPTTNPQTVAQAGEPYPPSSTNLSTFNKGIFEKRKRNNVALSGITEGTVSTEESSFSYMYPDPPKQDNPGYAKCPYCPKILTGKYLTIEYWRKHLHGDLRPYICLSEFCQTPMRFFADSKQWTDHMVTDHGKEWIQKVHMMTWYCDSAHDRMEFTSEEQLQNHLTRDHESLSDDYISSLVQLNWGIGCREEHVCPLCESAPPEIHPRLNDKDKDALLTKHIGDHFKALALFSLSSSAADTVNEGGNSSPESLQFPTSENCETGPVGGRRIANQSRDESWGRLSFDDTPMRFMENAGITEISKLEGDTEGLPNPDSEPIGWDFNRPRQASPQNDATLNHLRKKQADQDHESGSHLVSTVSADPPSSEPLFDPHTIFLNDNPVEDKRKSKAMSYTYDGNGLVPILSTEKDLGALLRIHCIEDGIDGEFWTYALLRHILSRDRIKDELMQPEYGFAKDQVNEYVNKIHPHSANAPSKTTYIKIFALLVLIEKIQDIARFIRDETCDDVLPIVISQGRNVYSSKEGNRHLLCFSGWKTHELEHFETRQWWVDTPYFDSTVNKPLTVITLDQGTHKPWRRLRGDEQYDGSEGAYGIVIPVEIHPTAHSFQQLLRGFAVKTLNKTTSNTKQSFLAEWRMLKQFNGLCHPHLVTALSAITQGDKWSFIFPCASSDFDRYKETIDPPKGRHGAMWLLAQLEGLIGAIDTIHDPRHLNLGPQGKYGRHGDIKCDNILCFKNSLTTDDVLVISDFGLSKLNSDKSRSNIPNATVPPVPGYRPPECDIEGGTISRAFDVWTIGCLFLELITWFLGGPSYVKEFEEKRTTEFINGSKNSIFFTFRELVPSDPGGAKAVLVKPEVTEWILQLRQHPNCSPFLHEVLGIIERKMLVVLSTDKTRSSSGELCKEFERISRRCNSEREYTQGKPLIEEKLREARNQIDQNTVAVRAIPNKHARALIGTLQALLPSHTGRTEMSYNRDQFEKMDIIGNKEDLHSSGN
ncbi:hypothetical protein QX201_012296 [Fusarium graminearum]|nr:hypothetical protein HG531_004764 [Fusarium graminearum]